MTHPKASRSRLEDMARNSEALRCGPARLLPQGVIAFAGHRLERSEVDDLDDAPRVADSASRLYLDGHLGDRRASNAQHLGKEFLRQRDRVGLCAISRLQ
jgi:hypothetical protein